MYGFGTWQLTLYCHYDKFVKVHMYVTVGNLHIKYWTLFFHINNTNKTSSNIGFTMQVLELIML